MSIDVDTLGFVGDIELFCVGVELCFGLLERVKDGRVWASHGVKEGEELAFGTLEVDVVLALLLFLGDHWLAG